MATSVFGAAPRALTGVITLQQTVDLVRLSIEVVESNIDEVVDPGDEPDLHEALLRYAREIAFATAQVYAQAAEARGAWDARLESLVVDAVLRSEADEGLLVPRRRPRLDRPRRCRGRARHGPGGDSETDLSTRYAAARAPRACTRSPRCWATGWSSCSAGSATPQVAAESLIGPFRRGPGRRRPGGRATWPRPRLRPRRALGAPGARGWQDAPRPVRADDLLPERAMAGDPTRASSWWRRSTDRWTGPAAPCRDARGLSRARLPR